MITAINNMNIPIKVVMMSIILTFVQISNSYASVSGEMEKVFQSFGGGANYTKGGAYDGQSGGYYTGGSLYARVPSRTYSIANFQPPSIKAGCGGIDIFGGSFSFIDSQQLVDAMRNVMGNTAGYAFNLALQEYVPIIYNTMQKLNDISRDINNMNINSCEMAAQALGGVWGKTDESSKLLCQAMGTSNGKFGDFAKAKQECGTGGKRGETNKDKKDDFKDQLGDEFNIAWEALKKQSMDQEVAELLMTISGTIIGKKEGSGDSERLQLTNHMSLINDEALFDTFLYGEVKAGGTAKVYKCDEEDKCLSVSQVDLTIDKEKALVPKIQEMLRNMAQKMRKHGGELTDGEKSLIELTQIPILRIIAVQNAFMAGNSVMNVNEFADSIAYDYLLGYLEKQLDFVSINLNQLAKVQMDGTHITNFKEDIAKVRTIITEKRYGAYQRILAVISVIEKSNLIEKKVEDMFTSYNELGS